MECPECKLEIPEDSKFCKECGHHLVNALFTDETKSLKKSERKHVTVLFSDMSGYTAMTERIDPEEVKEIMSLIFGKITDIIRDYDGFIERFIGDEVMAVFGVPKAHEDDPIRAIRAAIEIHTAVDKLSPRFEGKIGRSLAMHTGVNTGLVVTGEVNVEKGTHGLTGDAINLASRLEGIADANEILIGPNTYQQALNYFEFEALEPTKFKGKAELINVYKVLGFKRRPDMPHRMQGVQADLIGRNQEMAILAEAAQRLELGKGGIVCIVGEAGTGKSRLTREFKAKLDQDKIQWHEGHAYGYTQNSPYYPLANMLAYIFRIEEVDSQDQIRRKIESGLAGLIGQNTTAVHYIGGLFSIQYPETKNVSPEYWKSKLYDAVYQILNALASHGPTIICFEDQHWADPSTVAMLTQLLSGFSESVLFLCVYRPGFDLFADNQLKGCVHYLQEIHLQDLNDAQTHQMLGSLLKSESMPGELIDFVRSKSEGNPFYLEEVVNSLIESEVLIQDNDSWKLIQQITEENIPPSIHGILAARIDRLETHVKRVLQEASVIGRAFLYNVLKRITDIKRPVDQYLSGLEQLDLIRARSMEPDLEYIFKHALTQEVAYNGLLKKDRQEIHERIGLAIEQLFTNRLPEFYESLAFHFKQSQSVDKAVNYLIKAGHKGQSKYALEEAHQYYKEAYDLLSAKPDKNGDDHKLLVDLLLTWAEVFHFRGAYSDLVQVMGSHEKLVQESNNQKNLGMLYAWLGTGLRFKE
ncbi:MAG: adenylate/guanylate cyclase domain-containing protein, partial [Anaerolineales bacterium]